MSNEQFDRLEDMLATLIGKVGRVEGEIGQLKANVKGMESRLDFPTSTPFKYVYSCNWRCIL